MTKNVKTAIEQILNTARTWKLQEVQDLQEALDELLDEMTDTHCWECGEMYPDGSKDTCPKCDTNS
jgi:hypothetical protein